MEFAFNAASILQETNGLPRKLRTFFRGIPLDPPRAGISAKTFGLVDFFSNYFKECLGNKT